MRTSSSRSASGSAARRWARAEPCCRSAAAAVRRWGARTRVRRSGGTPSDAARARRPARSRRTGRGAGAQAREVEADRHRQGVAGGVGGVEEVQALVGGERGGSGACPAVQFVRAEVGGHLAGLGPQAPGERGRGQALGAAVLGERVEEGVGGRVVGLAGGAEDTGGGGEQHEGGQVQAGRQLVQVQCRVGLGAQDRVQALGRQGRDDAVVQGSGHVHHRRQLAAGLVEQGRESGTVGRVAGREAHAGARRLQVGAEFGGARGVLAPAGHEEQVPYAVPGHEVAGHQAAEGAGAAGDQDSAVAPGGVRLAGGGLRKRYAGEARRAQGAVADRDLGLVRRECGGDQFPGRAGGGVQVEEDEAARVLGLRRAHQAPHGGGHGIRGGVTGRDGATGHHDQAGRLEPLVGEPAPHGLQRAPQQGPHGAEFDRARGRHGIIGGRGCEQRQEQRRGRLGAVVEGGGQGLQVRVGLSYEGEGAGHVRGVVAEEGRRGGLTGPGRRGVDGGPLHLEEGVAARRTGQLLLGQGAQRERADGDDGLPGGVGGDQADGVGPGGGDAYPEGGGAGGVQRDAGPDEGQVCAVGPVDEVTEADGVQGGVEERRVQPEGLGVGVGLLRQVDLRVDVAALSPGGAQALEERAVAVPVGGEALVQVGHVDALGVRGRPGGQVGGVGGPIRGGGGQQAAGEVPRPGSVVGLVLRAGEQAEFAPPGVVRAAHRDLELDGTLLGDDERGLQGQLLQEAAADLVARAQGEFDVRRAGQQDRAVHGVVREPGVGLRRQPPREQVPVGVREGHGGPQQRVTGGTQPREHHVTGAGGDGLRPVTLALEGVRGEVDGGAGAGEEGLPVQLGAVGVGLGDGREQALGAAFVASKRAEGDRRTVGGVDRGLDRGPGAGSSPGTGRGPR
ncbi:putative Phenolphthiocerol synthesis polyketide synthase type I Pks15/1 [Streptomyces aurantiacus JA 4570]|uniref:Putative Phenolphthiocerol synthesis polyketide synthase type I Pks15/1 n=1 Tax=Streptomyces aurantiacus JA 4570 TaxID=1286094 RepID=S4AGJ1_9ACTN|nr:putative Phenolphthiocerol synthesis polyketide synthase type I Pks15/1 [Streptomyces aurantiacus JA 4570]